jgi:hypothetical protein
LSLWSSIFLKDLLKIFVIIGALKFAGTRINITPKGAGLNFGMG